MGEQTRVRGRKLSHLWVGLMFVRIGGWRRILTQGRAWPYCAISNHKQVHRIFEIIREQTLLGLNSSPIWSVQVYQSHAFIKPIERLGVVLDQLHVETLRTHERPKNSQLSFSYSDFRLPSTTQTRCTRYSALLNSHLPRIPSMAFKILSKLYILQSNGILPDVRQKKNRQKRTE